MVLLIYIFRYYETAQNSHFLSDIRFFKIIISDNFGGWGLKILRYIRIFDAVSELYCVLLSMSRRFGDKRSHLSRSTLYPIFWRYIRSNLRFTEEEP